jgi:hypothetical protein
VENNESVTRILIVSYVAIKRFHFIISTTFVTLRLYNINHTMDFLELIKRHWFLAGTMVAIFFAEIYPELGAKEGKINCCYHTLMWQVWIYEKMFMSA